VQSKARTQPTPKPKRSRAPTVAAGYGRVAADRGRARDLAATTAIHWQKAVHAARRVAAALTFSLRSAKSSPLSDGELFAAGALLLLFVAAAGSVLRLSVRLTGDSPTGRFG
jgi:hypothetical protein